MVLNYIWIGFFLIAFITGMIQAFVLGNGEVLSTMINSTFDAAKTGFEISLGLTGVLSLWLGLMKIGEVGGVIRYFSRLISPLFSKLFPEIPKNHPVFGSIFMNLSANMLGLDNAATPLGLKAMKEMQELNTVKDQATNAMIMFLVLNTSGLTLIPISVMVYRAQLGAANPTDVFLPILIATFVSTLVGTLACCLKQRINLFDKTIFAWILGLTTILGGTTFLFANMDQASISYYSSIVSNTLLLSIITGFIAVGLYKRINVYESFIDGAKEGFKTAVMIIPYLIGILVAIALFRASGAMDLVIDGVKSLFTYFNLDAQFVDALPTALMKPLSGAGARGLMVDTIQTHGADSFVGQMVSVIQGSTDTTFYILAVYFGSIGIKNSRYAASYGLLADFAGILAAISITYLFFGA